MAFSKWLKAGLSTFPGSSTEIEGMVPTVSDIS